MTPAYSKTLLVKVLVAGPKEVPGGHMSANLGLWYGTSPSAPAMQVKSL